MALWLVRTGRHGEYEQQFLDSQRIYVTWPNLTRDLRTLSNKQELQKLLRELYPASGNGKIINNSGQIWPFAHDMKVGDWVVVPSKTRPAIHIADIVGDYVFDAAAPDPFHHYRPVKWVARDVPRSNFDQDLLYSFGAFMTICRIERNDAEKRVRAMAATGWKSTGPPSLELDDAEEAEGPLDLERLARDQIAKAIIRRYKGHGLARLVEAVLKAQGYTTYLSPEGADKGVDLLAAPGPLGFGRPRICVQVKSGDAPLDAPTLNQLIGAMQNVQADQGLLVSWGGFKSSVDREIPAQFFRVRLWDQDVFIGELLAHYEKLDDDIKAELPLKRIWTYAAQEEPDSAAPD